MGDRRQTKDSEHTPKILGQQIGSINSMRLCVSLVFLLVGQSWCGLEIPSCPDKGKECISDEDHAKAYVDLLHYEFVRRSNKVNNAEWEYATNITDENSKAREDANLEYQKFTKEVSARLKTFNWKKFNDKVFKRLAKTYYIKGSDVDEDLLKLGNSLSSKLSTGYSTAKVCKFGEKDEPNCEKKMSLDPHLTGIFRSSRNPEELKYYWQAWRNAQNPSKQTYFDFQSNMKDQAMSTGYKDRQEEWLEGYEIEDAPSMMYHAWTKSIEVGGEQVSLEGLYKQLHAYVRSKLAQFYNEKGAEINEDGCIPAHLLGNMWAQSWGNIEDLVTPFPDSAPLNVTPALIEQKIDARKIFEISEEFFIQLGFDPMTDVFWNKTQYTKPKDRDVVCHASAWDMMAKDDFRLNDLWWELRNNLQGLDPAVAPRSVDNLDPLAKYHVAGDVPYIRYFVSFVTQFQFYEALCKKAGEYDPKDPETKPLYLCDYSSGGVETGALLRDMMVKGGSQHWELAMREVTGKTDMSGESIVRYFLPLYKYLKQQNQGQTIGWKDCFADQL